jgi:hypothetical protein
MSAISGVGQGLAQFFQSISSSSQCQPTSASTSASAADSTAAADSSQQVHGSGHHHHGGGGEGGGAFFQKIQQAVTNALQSAATSGTSADPNTTIEDAIAQIFQNNPTSPSSSTATDESDSDGATTSETDASNPQSFIQTLQSYGVDPQQFHQDFMTAIKNAMNGQVDPGTAFANFPPGTIVDTTA